MSCGVKAQLSSKWCREAGGTWGQSGFFGAIDPIGGIGSCSGCGAPAGADDGGFGSPHPDCTTTDGYKACIDNATVLTNALTTGENDPAYVAWMGPAGNFTTICSNACNSYDNNTGYTNPMPGLGPEILKVETALQAAANSKYDPVANPTENAAILKNMKVCLYNYIEDNWNTQKLGWIPTSSDIDSALSDCITCDRYRIRDSRTAAAQCAAPMTLTYKEPGEVAPLMNVITPGQNPDLTPIVPDTNTVEKDIYNEICIDLGEFLNWCYDHGSPEWYLKTMAVAGVPLGFFVYKKGYGWTMMLYPAAVVLFPFLVYQIRTGFTKYIGYTGAFGILSAGGLLAVTGGLAYMGFPSIFVMEIFGIGLIGVIAATVVGFVMDEGGISGAIAKATTVGVSGFGDFLSGLFTAATSHASS